LLAVSAGALLWGTNGVIVHAVGHRSGLSAQAIGCYRLLFASGVLMLAYTRSSLAR
jgi:DME family drug/metabolite transporter